MHSYYSSSSSKNLWPHYRVASVESGHQERDCCNCSVSIAYIDQQIMNPEYIHCTGLQKPPHPNVYQKPGLESRLQHRELAEEGNPGCSEMETCI